MEEKKIMWVVLSISLFVLVVFGSALVLYSPSKFQSPNAPQDFAYSRDISDISNRNSQKVDPDMWSRQGETVPGFQATDEEENGRKSITVIDGSEVEDGKKYIDVSPLNSEDAQRLENGKKLPTEVAMELGANVQTEKKEQKGNRKDSTISSDVVLPAPNKDYALPRETKEATVSNTGNKKGKNVSKPTSRSDGQKANERTVEKKESLQTQKSLQQPKPVQQKLSIETVYWVQTASLSSRLNAEKARDKLAERHMKVQIFTRDQSSGLTHRVRVGPFSNKTEAEYWLKNIKDIQGFEQSYISEERVRV